MDRNVVINLCNRSALLITRVILRREDFRPDPNYGVPIIKTKLEFLGDSLLDICEQMNKIEEFMDNSENRIDFVDIRLLCKYYDNMDQVLKETIEFIKNDDA